MEKKNKIYSIILAYATGLLLALLTVTGFVTKHNHGFVMSLSVVFIAVILTVMIGSAMLAFFSMTDKFYLTNRLFGKGIAPAKSENVSKKSIPPVAVFFIVFAIFLICWFPYFLAMYPGMFAYDNEWQYFMYADKEITNHQPVIHTLILGFLIHTVEDITGSINKGVAAYTLFQMVLMGLGSAFIPYTIYKKIENKFLFVASIIFLAFYPVFVIFVFTGTKDTLFSMAIADFMILNLDLFDAGDEFLKKRGNRILWILLAFIIYSFRNNAVYAMLPVLPFAIIFIAKKCKKYRRKALATLLFTAALFVFYSGPFTTLVAKEKVSKAEMMSVPCQQIVRVYTYRYDELPESERATFEEFFDPDMWLGYYVPEIADAAKGRLRMDIYEAKSGEYWKLWATWLKRYPNEYVNSFLENTYGLYYMWPHYVLYSFGQEGFTVMHQMDPVVPNSKLPALYTFLCNFEDGDLVIHNRFTSWLFAPATFLYIGIAACVYVLRNKKFRLLIPIAFLALLWCTFLLGPVALVRYVLFLYILLPVWPLYMRASFNGENK